VCFIIIFPFTPYIWLLRAGYGSKDAVVPSVYAVFFYEPENKSKTEITFNEILYVSLILSLLLLLLSSSSSSSFRSYSFIYVYIYSQTSTHTYRRTRTCVSSLCVFMCVCVCINIMKKSCPILRHGSLWSDEGISPLIPTLVTSGVSSHSW
jgi:hypothetical protein